MLKNVRPDFANWMTVLLFICNMYQFFKPLLFLIPPETAHAYTLRILILALKIPGIKTLLKGHFCFPSPTLEKKVFGLAFPNPVGLAAGFDKDGRYLEAMAHLGFGFIEVGTVTPRPQAGNPKPRLFRLPADQALVNRMGFNNAGADALAERLRRGKPSSVVLGINIGKNKETPNERACDDYLYCFHTLFPFADYFVVNVSSPNTPDLRALQDKEPLTKLLQQLQEANARQAPAPKPILLKIAPDLNESQLDDIVEIAEKTHLSGIIATNTTTGRSHLNTTAAEVERIGNGGLSGKPLKAKSTEVIQYLAHKSKGKLPIIGVGGISNEADAKEKIYAGAGLVQIYSGLVYQGPSIVKKILRGLA